jgi:hypothetical protein
MGVLMKIRSDRFVPSIPALLLYLLCVSSVCSQQNIVTPEIPDKFNLDIKTAARLRPLLLARSTAALSRYETGQKVLDRLVTVAQKQKKANLTWVLRITNGELWNAFSSPDGTIYVDSSLAQLAGSDARLWAGILSHEIAHIIHRDWARRYLYEKSLQGNTVVVENSVFSSGAWIDASAASECLARFCRQVELDADAEGLMFMARAGYHLISLSRCTIYCGQKAMMSLRHRLMRCIRAGKCETVSSSTLSVSQAWNSTAFGRNVTPRQAAILPSLFLPKIPPSKQLVLTSGKSGFPCDARTWLVPWKLFCERGPHGIPPTTKPAN